MSLPPATKDISNKPAAGSVVDPVNKQAKDADVDRKIRLYGIVEAFRLGRLPSNAQIDQTLQYVLDHSPVHVDKLSPDGKKLVQDVQDIIETARLMVQEKNADELFQQFVWHTTEVDQDAIRQSVPGREGVPVDHEKVGTEGQQAVKHLRTLLSLVLTNSEVRKLLSDFSLIGRDLLSTGLQKAAAQIAPSKDALANVDQTGPQDEFITEGGRSAGPGETPVLEARIPGTGVSVKQHPKEGGARIRGEDGEERDAGEVRGVVGEETQNFKEGARGGVQDRTGVDPADRDQVKGTGAAQAQGSTGYTDDYNSGVTRQQKAEQGAGQAKDVGKDAVHSGAGNANVGRLEGVARGIFGNERIDRVQGGAHQGTENAHDRAEKEAGERAADADTSHDEDVEKKGGFMGKMRDFRDTMTDRVPQEQRDRVERGKKFLTEEYFPEERRDQFIYRGKKVIIECQKHEDYQESLRWLLGHIEEYAVRGREMAGKGREDAKGVGKDRALQDAILEIRTLLERFANGQSMDTILDAFYALSDDAKRDAELRAWFKDVNAYTRKVLLEPGYVLEPDCNNNANRLRESGRHFYDDKYKAEFDNLFGSVGNWFKAMGEDPINKRFGEDWARLTHDLLFDSEGSLKFKADLWNDIRKVILPELVDKVGYIPIPRIEYTDDAVDLVVENLTLSGRNLFPNIVSLEAHNFVKFSPYSAIQDESHHRFTLTFGQMQADMRDVAFYYKKKTGMPKLSDSGLADVVLGGEGLTASVVLVSAEKDRSSVFHVHDVHVKVDSLKFSIRDSKHDFLYKIVKPLATRLVKRQIQKAITEAIRTGLEYADGQLVAVRDRMESAKETEGESRGKVLQELFMRKKEEAASTTSTSHSQFKVVSNKRNSLLQNAGHPSGWVNRTAEKDELAAKGKEWRSDAFTIVR